jgi:hypothetical protein
MANEIQFNATLQASKGGATINKVAGCTLNMAGTQMAQITQSIPTAWTLLVFGNLTGVPSKALIINLDPANYVQLAADNTGTQIQDEIQPGGDFVIRSPFAAIYAKAHTAACILSISAMDA